MYFQWLNWARTSLNPTLNLWIINMDETSMQNEYATKRGYVVGMQPEQREKAGCFHQRVEMSSTRTHSTLAAFISGRPGTIKNAANIHSKSTTLHES